MNRRMPPREGRTSRAQTAHRTPRAAHTANAPRPAAPPRGIPAGLALLGCWAALLAALTWAQRLPAALPWLALAVNALTFAVYAQDKRAARAGRRRTSERTLHLLALLGGWPAAWCAQQWLRHKTSKRSFRAVYWASSLTHCVAIAGVAFFWKMRLLLF